MGVIGKEGIEFLDNFLGRDVGFALCGEDFCFFDFTVDAIKRADFRAEEVDSEGITESFRTDGSENKMSLIGIEIKQYRDPGYKYYKDMKKTNEDQEEKLSPSIDELDEEFIEGFRGLFSGSGLIFSSDELESELEWME